MPRTTPGPRSERFGAPARLGQAQPDAHVFDPVGDVGEWGETYVILRELFLASEHRGRDASGFAAMTEPLDRPARRTMIVGKSPVTSSQFVNTDERWLGMARRRSSAVIQHVRAATHGDTDTG